MNLYEETKKYLKKTEENIWELTSPHVLYLSREQAQSYTANKEDDDYRRFHDETIEIVEDNVSEILSPYKDGLTLVDLGPEYPDKTMPTMKDLKSKRAPFYYVPVDINEDYLKMATDAARPFATEVFDIQAMFETCAPLIPVEAGYDRLVFIGLTFMNFDPVEILKTMKDIAGPSGAVVVATELLTSENKIEDIEESYRNDRVASFSMGPLLNLNIDPQILEFDVRFRKKRIEFGFIINSNVPNLGFVAGDRFISGVSYRYEKESFESLLKEAVGKTNLWTSKSGKTALAISKIRL